MLFDEHQNAVRCHSPDMPIERRLRHIGQKSRYLLSGCLTGRDGKQYPKSNRMDQIVCFCVRCMTPLGADRRSSLSDMIIFPFSIIASLEHFFLLSPSFHQTGDFTFGYWKRGSLIYDPFCARDLTEEGWREHVGAATVPIRHARFLPERERRRECR